MRFAARRVGPVRKKHFPANPPALLHVSHVFAYKVQRNRRIDGAYQVCRKHKAPVHGDHHIQPTSVAGPRNFPAQSVDATSDTCSGISGHFRHGHDSRSSMIITPARVALPAANSAATGKPRAQITCSPSLTTGQEALSHRLIPNSLKSRASLCAFWWPTGRNTSPGNQFRTTRGKRNLFRSRKAPVSLVSRPSPTQSITLNRSTVESSTTGTLAAPE